MPDASNGASHAPAAASAGPKFNAERLGKIKSFFQDYVDSDKYSGLLALVNCNGEDVFRESIGHFDKEAQKAMPFDAIFRIMVC